MADSQKNSSVKCFSSILRRFMCIGSLQTHPSEDLFIEHQTENVHKPREEHDSKPGLVARLMGLDSLPDHTINSSRKERSFGSYLRSRSVNFLDYGPVPFDLSRKLIQHRRVKTSISISEVLESVNQDGHEFFLVRFEEVDEEQGRKGLQVKPETRHRQVKQKRMVQSKAINDNNGEKFVAKRSSKRVKDSKGNVKAPRRLKHHPSNIKHRSNNNVAKKKQHGWHKENTSPVSENAGRKHPKKPPQKFKNFEGPICNKKTPSSIPSNLEKPLMKTLETDYCRNMLNSICKLSENDIKGTCNWIAACEVLAFEDLEEICVLFGQQIFEVLLNQVVDELLMLKLTKD